MELDAADISKTHESTLRNVPLDSFALYDTLAKTIKSLLVRSQMLPRILKPEKQKQLKQLNGSSSPKPQREELALQLETFQEQEALLQGYIRDAQRNWKYDDVKTLQRTLEEVRAEIDRIKCNLA
ncbi:hypothetical protein VTP01DRAFT_5508 [Rhizomucor pusillus]|uniref:uncharacterized protein n=1 Tax=Rhizomucor pusillus TaxID=4840 RepID=UPI0037448A96